MLGIFANAEDLTNEMLYFHNHCAASFLQELLKNQGNNRFFLYVGRCVEARTMRPCIPDTVALPESQSVLHLKRFVRSELKKMSILKTGKAPLYNGKWDYKFSGWNMVDPSIMKKKDLMHLSKLILSNKINIISK